MEPFHGSLCFSKAALGKFNQPKRGGLFIVERDNSLSPRSELNACKQLLALAFYLTVPF